MNEAIRDKITQRRHQIMVHSCIYYQYNTNIIDDHTYDRWAMELGDLHAKYPTEAKAAEMAKEFEGFTTETASGFDLAYHDPRTVSKAAWLIEFHKEQIKKRRSN
ncbi:hypothetical protein COM73_19005 [Bacillus thuringiensis]|nr:hypothetical protein [Bacillus thuringiensis]PEE69376.1 hypothetical protein COM73_19005 [Bacillus thuringiensis]